VNENEQIEWDAEEIVLILFLCCTIINAYWWKRSSTSLYRGIRFLLFRENSGASQVWSEPGLVTIPSWTKKKNEASSSDTIWFEFTVRKSFDFESVVIEKRVQRDERERKWELRARWYLYRWKSGASTRDRKKNVLSVCLSLTQQTLYPSNVKKTLGSAERLIQELPWLCREVAIIPFSY